MKKLTKKLLELLACGIIGIVFALGFIYAILHDTSEPVMTQKQRERQHEYYRIFEERSENYVR